VRVSQKRSRACTSPAGRIRVHLDVPKHVSQGEKFEGSIKTGGGRADCAARRLFAEPNPAVSPRHARPEGSKPAEFRAGPREPRHLLVVRETGNFWGSANRPITTLDFIVTHAVSAAPWLNYLISIACVAVSACGAAGDGR
jgi:hypothetical protein